MCFSSWKARASSPKAHKGEGFRISSGVRDRVLKEKSSILVRDAQLDDAFKGRMSIVEQKVHTMMAVPLETKQRIIGLIYVDSPFVLREFTKDDLSLLTVMANVAAIRIENVRLAEVEQAERIMKRDLSQAAEIQGRMLPDTRRVVPGADLAGFNAACRTVGGDYYDFFPYADGRVGLALGDVSGKGMPASLMMMALHARVQVLAEDPGDLAAFMTRLNKATCANCPSNRFITFFFCVLNTATGELTFANAGHNPPIVVRASGEAQMLEGGGPVLGILPVAPYSEQRERLGPGDLLVLYSDGVTEANERQLRRVRRRALYRGAEAASPRTRRRHCGRGHGRAGRIRRRRAPGGRHHAGGGQASVVSTPARVHWSRRLGRDFLKISNGWLFATCFISPVAKLKLQVSSAFPQRMAGGSSNPVPSSKSKNCARTRMLTFLSALNPASRTRNAQFLSRRVWNMASNRGAYPFRFRH